MDEGIIEKMCPYSVHQFSTTVGQDTLLLSVPVRMELSDRILEGVGKLTVFVNWCETEATK